MTSKRRSKQTKLVLDTDKDRLDAMLLEARAPAESGASDAEKRSLPAVGRGRSSRRSRRQPAFLDAYHELAEIELKRGRGRRRSRLSSAT